MPILAYSSCDDGTSLRRFFSSTNWYEKKRQIKRRIIRVRRDPDRALQYTCGRSMGARGRRRRGVSKLVCSTTNDDRLSAPRAYFTRAYFTRSRNNKESPSEHDLHVRIRKFRPIYFKFSIRGGQRTHDIVIYTVLWFLQ